MKLKIEKLKKLILFLLPITLLFVFVRNSDFSNQLLVSIAEDRNITFFSFLIIALTVLGSILPILFNGEKLRSIALSLPSLLPAIGLVGTFIGIYLGLVEFNPADIDGSLPSLLAGLKVAFTTSILGIIGSLLVKFSTYFYPDLINEDEISEIEFYKLFRKQNDLTVETNKRLVALETQFKDFASSIGDTTIEHLVDAIDRVMTDFNKKVETQFGENFKKFNEGLISLLKWQENYKNEVEENLKIIREAKEILQLHETTSKNLNQVLDEFSLKTKSITTAIERVDAQHSNIEKSLQTFSEVSKQANEVIPTLEKQIQSLTRNLDEELKGVSENLKTLDEEMSSELQKALNVLAANLGALTEQFVKDYQPLMIALRDIVESGKVSQK
ncbi:MAG: hypothetical protein VW948_03625 [Burkholderiaceae bacterium]|jgi:hypothetical protein